MLIKKCLIFFILSVFSILVINSVNAQIIGADITYKHLSGTKYEFTLTYFRDCEHHFVVNDKERIDATPSNCNAESFSIKLKRQLSLSEDVSPSCPERQNTCQQGTAPGVFKEVYKGTKDLKKRCEWKFTWLKCTETDKLTNIENNSENEECVFISSTLNNKDKLEVNSPQFTRPSFQYDIVGKSSEYNPSVNDPDNDSIMAELIKPKNFLNQTVNFKTGYSAQSPVSSSSPVTLDKNTGVLNYKLDKEQRSLGSMEIKKFYNDKVISTVERNFQIIGIKTNNQKPFFSKDDGDNVFDTLVCAGDEIKLDINASDPDQNDKVWMEWDGAIKDKGATFKLSGNGTSSPSGIFEWTPGNGDAGKTHVFRVTIKDDKCPIVGTQTKTYKIKVFENPFISLTKPDTAISCEEKVKVSANTFFGKSPYEYQWNIGNEVKQGDTVNVPIGFYNVTVTDNSPAKCQTTKEFEIKGGIDADFKADSLCLGDITRFTDLSSTQLGKINSWKWNFGDNSTSEKANPEHKYKQEGEYNVVLEVKDNQNCEATINKTIKVCKPPEADFTYNDSCQFHPKNGQSVPLQSLPDSKICDIKKYKWDFGDGETGSVKNSLTTHNYSDSGKFVIKHTVINEQGCKNQTSKEIKIHPHPRVEILTESYFHNCSVPPKEIVAEGHARPKDSEKNYFYQWNDPGNTTTFIDKSILSNTEKATKDTIKWDTAGLAEVTLVDQYGCYFRDNLEIKKPVQAEFDKNLYCEKGDTIHFKSSSFSKWGIDSLIWHLGDGTRKVNQEEFSYFYPKDSVFNVSLKVIDKSGCTGIYNERHINVLPEDTFSISSDTLCFEEPFRYYSPEGSPVGDWVESWKWSFKKGNINLKPLVFDEPFKRVSDTVFTGVDGNINTNLKVFYNKDTDADSSCVRVYDTSFYINEELVSEISIDDFCSKEKSNFEARKISGKEYPITEWKWLFNYRSGQLSPFTPIDSAKTRTTKKNFDTTGQIKASLKMKNAFGCENVHDTIFGYKKITNNLNFNYKNNCLNDSVQMLGKDFKKSGINQYTFKILNENKTYGPKNGPFQKHRFKKAGNNKVEFSALGYVGVNEELDTCVTTTVQDVFIKKSPEARFSDHNICIGDKINFDGSSSKPATDSTSITNYEWRFTNGDTLKGINIKRTYNNLGNFPVELFVKDGNACTDTTRRSVSVKRIPVADFDFTEGKRTGETVEFIDKSTEAVKWHWSFGDGDTALIKNASNGNTGHIYSKVKKFPVELTVFNKFGCPDTTTKFVDMRPHLILPNAFSPNGDNINDKLSPIHLHIKELKFLRVYNRWGELIYETKGNIENAAWDGTYKGSPQPVGTYVVYASAISIYNNELSVKTEVTLIR